MTATSQRTDADLLIELTDHIFSSLAADLTQTDDTDR
jgi:hypothetical protein